MSHSLRSVGTKKFTEEFRQLTRGALSEMRTVLLELRPATRMQTRLPITLTIEGECQLPPEV